jgi:anti-sigma factor RsiW
MLLEAISRGEFTIQGLRNRELQRLLYPAQADRVQKRRRSAAITRRLALLRAHGLIKKVSGTHRYILTHNGRRIITALLTARRADVDQLTRIAA